MSRKYILLLSDLHLNPSNTRLTASVSNLLSVEKHQAEAIYILGGLFDFWLSGSEEDPAYAQILSILRETTEHCPVYLILGNRDFLIDHKFAQITGITILPQYTIAEFFGTPYLLLPGDTLCTKDKPYIFFRVFVRSQFLLKLITWLSRKTPISLRHKLLSKIQNIRVNFNNLRQRKNRASPWDISEDLCKQIMEKHEVDSIIHGYTQLPAIHEYTNDVRATSTTRSTQTTKRRFVLGNWGDTHAWVIRINACGEHLENFLIQTQEEEEEEEEEEKKEITIPPKELE